MSSTTIPPKDTIHASCVCPRGAWQPMRPVDLDGFKPSRRPRRRNMSSYDEPPKDRIHASYVVHVGRGEQRAQWILTALSRQEGHGRNMSSTTIPPKDRIHASYFVHGV